MKKYVVWMMVFALLLCAACQKQPETPATPEVPQQPPQQEQPVAPETPATALEGPEECQILMAVKPEQTMFLRQRVAFLDGRTVAMVAPTDAGQQVQIVELVEGKVLSTFDLPGSYGETGRSVRLSAVTDKYHLSCHDGTDAWSILVDEDWQMEGWIVQPVEPELPTQWQMGSHIVTKNEEGSILVDGQVVLQGDRVVMAQAEPGGLWYGIKAVLDDHRLLFACGGAYESEYMGIYDHETGETWTFGQKGCQIQQLDDHRWILYHDDHLRCYGLAFLDTDAETLTPLDTGFETIGTAADLMEMNVENTRLALADLEAGQAVIKLYDLTSGQLLYHWNGPMSVQWLWAKPVGANKLVILTDRDGRSKSYQVPEVPAVPETPVLPEMPEVPVIVEPEGFVSAVKLPAVVPGAQRVDGIIPLKDNTAALLAADGEKTRLLLYDYAASVVLAQKEVPVYGECVLTRMDGSTFYFADGKKGWQVTADASLAMAEYRLEDRLKMGNCQVTAINGSLYIDGQPVLEAAPGKAAYLLVAVLDDHRLLYNDYSAATSLQGTYGVYDHTTGEKKLLTTLGQHVVGVWSDTLLIARQHAGGWYELGKYDLTDYSFTPLHIGHEKIDHRVEHIHCNDGGTRLQVTWTDADGIHVQVFDLETQQELYTWTAPAGEDWNFFPVGDNGLAVWTGESDDLTVWKVEY